jgi:hypothetical protein
MTVALAADVATPPASIVSEQPPCGTISAVVESDAPTLAARRALATSAAAALVDDFAATQRRALCGTDVLARTVMRAFAVAFTSADIESDAPAVGVLR